jgi:hypothetical protein
MSYTPVLNDVIEIKTYCQNSEQMSVNTFHAVANPIFGGGVNQATIAAKWDSLVAPLLKPMMAPDSTYYGVSVAKIWPLPRTAFDISIAGRGAGTAAPPSLPRQTSFPFTLTTSGAGRNQRGRWFIAFPAAAFNAAGGVPTAAYLLLVAPLVTQVGGGFLAGSLVTGTTMTTILWHSRTKTFDTVTGANPAVLKWGTQRRRGSYGRPNSVPF